MPPHRRSRRSVFSAIFSAMETNYIALAIPFFFLLIALELWAARRRGRDYYRLSDSVSDLSTGILQQLVSLLFAGFMVAGYLFLYEHLRVADLSASSMLVWIGCFVGVDFLYYWFHRLSHEINFLWAAHVVHHQSEEYNLTVALRQSTLQPFQSMVFYWPLALVGVPPAVYLACASFNTLYQFWIHTRVLGTLGPLERVLMTPSHHRVHHGRNPRYIDRNHGGTFIVWDKLFGTFEPEGEEVVYGITKPLASWNPIWANLHYWKELWDSARATRRWKDKLRVFLKPPGWFPEDLGGFQPPPPVRSAARSYDPPLSRALSTYVVAQFVQVLALSMVFIAGSPTLSTPVLTLLAAGVTWGLVDVCALADGAPWAGRSEWLRLVAMPLGALAMAPGGVAGWLAIGLAANGVFAWRVGVPFEVPARQETPREQSAPSSPAPRRSAP